jgi:hypothetical protein
VWTPRTVKVPTGPAAPSLPTAAVVDLGPVGACTATVGVLLVKGLGPWAMAGACLGPAALGLCLGLAKRWRG